MKMKSVLTVLAVLALFTASSALAAAPGPKQQAKVRIEQQVNKANKICRDKRLGPKTRSKQVCNRYGICNPNVSCTQAVQQWKERSLADLRRGSAAKKAVPPPPPQQGKNHVPQPPPQQQGMNQVPPPPPQQGQNHMAPPPPPGQPR